MPLNVRLIGVVVLLVLGSFFGVLAQSPTSADVMRERVTKAKAYIAVKNFGAAIYELEGIRRETNDPTLHGVVNVILMNCYLEQGDYKRAQNFLNELYNAQKVNKPNAAQHYFAVAAQVVKGARSQAERYKALGLSVNDRNLPPAAVTDIEKMRETVELVISQSKTMTADKSKASTALALVEESSSARVALARDDFDANRWKEEMSDAREILVSSRATVINAVDDDLDNTVASNNPGYTNPAQTETTQPNIVTTSQTVAPNPQTVAKNEQKPQDAPKMEAPKTEAPRLEPIKTEQPRQIVPEPVKETPKQLTPNVAPNTPQAETNATPQVKAPVRERRVNASNQNQTDVSEKRPNVAPNMQNVAENKNADETKTSSAPLNVGSLVEYATEKVNPVYPQQAKALRMTGVVKIEVVVDEEGKIAEVQNTSGPSVLQRAALEALKKWKFKPFVKDGQPTKATGFVNFNFNL